MSADPGDLANLADLALPPPAPFWPPAAGVWIVAAAVLAALAVAAWRALRRYRADAYLRAAGAELDALAAGQGTSRRDMTEAVSAVLKRAAMVAYGREQVASLTGAAWAQFIAGTAPPGTAADTVAASLAASQGAVPGAEPVEPPLLIAQAKAWLRGQSGRAAKEA